MPRDAGGLAEGYVRRLLFAAWDGWLTRRATVSDVSMFDARRAAPDVADITATPRGARASVAKAVDFNSVFARELFATLSGFRLDGLLWRMDGRRTPWDHATRIASSMNWTMLRSSVSSLDSRVAPKMRCSTACSLRAAAPATVVSADGTTAQGDLA